jgi:AraC-like DNA-binding protein
MYHQEISDHQTFTPHDQDYGETNSILIDFIGAVLPPDEAKVVLRGVYTEALHSSLLDHLSRLRCDIGRRAAPLAKWRLARVYSFVDANIEERISLEMLARTAGISKMYFAAQFREATGMRPHTFLLRRRIALAKQLLRDARRSIVDVALSVGFQTQSHFTTVFKHQVGVTPYRWRQGDWAEHKSYSLEDPASPAEALA